MTNEQRMSPDDLLRCLDGKATASEIVAARETLAAHEASRAFVREVAEQAIMANDLFSTSSFLDGKGERVNKPESLLAGYRVWPWAFAAMAFSMMALAVWGAPALTRSQTVAKATRVTGVVKQFGAGIRDGDHFKAGDSLRLGDTLETSSCDAWVDLSFDSGEMITLASHSELRIQLSHDEKPQIALTNGNLWYTTSGTRIDRPLELQTPAAKLVSHHAQFDLHATDSETSIRVNSGELRAIRVPDESEVVISSGKQAVVSMGDRSPINVITQPSATDHWKVDIAMHSIPLFGTWIGANDAREAGIAASPLVWPVEGGKSIMLYAAALQVWKGNERPVRLHADSRLAVRGRCRFPHTVRFGLSLQRTQGVFAGKFELDQSPEQLKAGNELISDMDYFSTFAQGIRQDGEWEVVITVAEFQPLYPQIWNSIEGMELNNVYALTVDTDAGLELLDVELLPPLKMPEFEKVH